MQWWVSTNGGGTFSEIGGATSTTYSFTATTGSDTYRVLRLPGIGVALVSEGASAAEIRRGPNAGRCHQPFG